MGTVKRLLEWLLGSRGKEKAPPPPPHDVIAVRFEWDGGSCFIQKSMPAAAVPRRGDTVTVLTKHAVIEGDVHRVWWVLNEGDPGWEYIAGPDGSVGTYGRARVRAFVELADARMPSKAAGRGE